MEGTEGLANNLGFTRGLHASEGLGRMDAEGTYSGVLQTTGQDPWLEITGGRYKLSTGRNL